MSLDVPIDPIPMGLLGHSMLDPLFQTSWARFPAGSHIKPLDGDNTGLPALPGASGRIIAGYRQVQTAGGLLVGLRRSEPGSVSRCSGQRVP